ncbi:hypothetical protein BDZ89DRAFT_1033423 [Hymenopellis radicata]|nr:hypothetical protein BDZ89DRAFT_1033423 [Hymenopellis radicata]
MANTNLNPFSYILSLAMHPGLPNLDNLFTANANTYIRLPISSNSYKIITAAETLKTNPKDAAFYTIGRVASSHLLERPEGHVRNIAVQPILRFASHILLNASLILHFHSPQFEIAENGLVASTTLRTRDDFDGKAGCHHTEPPMDGITHGPVPRPDDRIVPCFDGRHHLYLPYYYELDKIVTKLEIGDIVLITFALRGHTDEDGAEFVELKIMFAILLARWHDQARKSQMGHFDNALTSETPLTVVYM